MNADIISMLGNLSQSLLRVQELVAGLAYLIGIVLMILALIKLRKIGDSRARGGAGGHIFVPIAYLLGGTALIFLPNSITVMSNTAFGISGNILQYQEYNPFDIYRSMRIIVQTAGLIWFVRGCVLLVHSSEPGVQHGPKGLAFLVAGTLAVNFEGTIGFLQYILDRLLTL